MSGGQKQGLFAGNCLKCVRRLWFLLPVTVQEKGKARLLASISGRPSQAQWATPQVNITELTELTKLLAAEASARGSWGVGGWAAGRDTGTGRAAHHLLAQKGLLLRGSQRTLRKGGQCFSSMGSASVELRP